MMSETIERAKRLIRDPHSVADPLEEFARLRAMATAQERPAFHMLA
jgi:hypothetical protein